MMFMMPAMSVYIGFILPASLGLYWITMQRVLYRSGSYFAKVLRCKAGIVQEVTRQEAARQDRLRRMEAAKHRPQVQAKNTSKEKQKRQHQHQVAAAHAKKKNSTTEAGRVGDRPYARGRSYGSHYDDLD